MTLPRLREMKNYWQHNPPIHLMIAAYLGIKSKPAEASESVNDPAEIEAFLALLTPT